MRIKETIEKQLHTTNQLKKKALKKAGYSKLKKKALRTVGYPKLKKKALKKVGYPKLKKKALRTVGYPKALTKKLLKQIEKRFASARHGYYSKKEKGAVDKMLFSFEKLPVLGKEYWFLLFIEKDGKRQLVVTFGRGRSEGYSVNEASVRRRTDANNIFECWFYDKGIKEQPTRTTRTKVNKTGLVSKGDGIDFRFSGSYPEYDLLLNNKGEEIACLKLKVPEKGERFEFIEYFKAMFGFGAVSMFPEFKGTLSGKRFEGSCYVQKVVATAPIIPWNWVRVHFRNGSVLTYFTLKIPKTPKKFSASLSFYDAETNKRHTFPNAKMSKFGKTLVHVYLEADSRDSDLECTLKVYAVKKFRMENKTLFNYIEYLAETENIRFRTGKHVVSEKKLGKGIGFIEDTDGILI